MEGSWIWDFSEARAGFTSWRRGQPDNHRGNSDCAYVYLQDGDWDDADCSASIFASEKLSMGAICEAKTTTTKTSTTTAITTTIKTIIVTERTTPVTPTNETKTKNSFSLILSTDTIAIISLVSVMTLIFLGLMTRQAVDKCIKWKMERDAKRGPKTDENEDYGESDDDATEDAIEHENVYYGEVISFASYLNKFYYLQGINQEWACKVRDNNSQYGYE